MYCVVAGVLWNSDQAVSLARKAHEASNIDFQGIYIFCGNSYTSDKQKREEVQRVTTERILELKSR